VFEHVGVRPASLSRFLGPSETRWL